MGSQVIEIEGLWHRYTKDWALQDISVSVGGRGVIGLLGSNGAGKSTLMNILCGCLSQSKGRVAVAGLNIRSEPLKARQQIGFLPQQAPLSNELTIDEYVRFSACLRQVPASRINKAVDFVIERCGLKPMRKRMIGNLSGGYRQRVGIAQALVHRPQLIVLDEPTVGLDPNQMSGVRNLIQEIGEEHAVVFSSHIMPEVEALCRDVLMIERGEAVFHGGIDEFRALAKPHEITMVGSNLPTVTSLKQLHGGIVDVEQLSGSKVRISSRGDRAIARSLIAMGEANSWGIEEVYFERTSLEDVFKTLSLGKVT